MIGGVSVTFPAGRRPFAPQLAVMARAVAACDRGEHALLESPTGTGKTLALLCSTLSWQAHRYNVDCAVRARASAPVDPGSALLGLAFDSDHGGPAARQQPIVPGSGKQQPAVKRHKVFFASRTHTQLAQVVRELKTVQGGIEGGVRMTLLASREHYCVNGSVRRSKKGRDDECKRLLETAAGCKYAKRAHVLKAAAGAAGAWDVEDLVAQATTTRGCPYFASRALVPEASLLLCP